MNENKIAFIICTNNELYFDECIWYINQLIVPDGYVIDIISISDAASICEAYNAAMQSSDAKYKVYLHQDVFIYNQQFIIDILKEFQSDEALGMLGVIGGINLPQDAIIWNTWNVGTSFVCDYNRAYCLNFYQSDNGSYVEAEAIDGMIMVTQYDINWREDLELGWDFYDISQSLEFRKKGYKIGVPYQKEPWCMHDCGRSKLIHYDASRGKILNEYKDFFSGQYESEYDAEKYEEKYLLEEQFYSKIISHLDKREFLEAFQIKESIGAVGTCNNNLRHALNIMEIWGEEQISEAETSFFENCDSWEMLRNKYDEIKLIIRHMENDTNMEHVNILMKMIQEKELSKEAVWSIAKHYAVNRAKVFRKLIEVT